MRLKLSADQFAELEQNAAYKFYDELERFLRSEMPEACEGVTSEDMQAFIRTCEQRCNLYDIRSDASISQFACLSLGAGEFIDDIEGVKEVLTHTGVDPEDRMDLLTDAIDSP